MSNLTRNFIMVTFFTAFMSCSHFVAFNPLPPLNQIKNANIVHQVKNLSAPVPKNKITAMHSLFQKSTKDMWPSKWQVFSYIDLILLNGKTETIYIYSTGTSVGAFKYRDQYYRGGSDESFESFF